MTNLQLLNFFVIGFQPLIFVNSIASVDPSKSQKMKPVTFKNYIALIYLIK